MEIASIRARRTLPPRLWGSSSARALGTNPQRAPHRLGKIVTVCPAFQEVLGIVSRIAGTQVALTISGETGTGKDVLAHALHDISPRRDEPFVVFDCGAVAANLAESELFGHERGAFTGAV